MDQQTALWAFSIPDGEATIVRSHHIGTSHKAVAPIRSALTELIEGGPRNVQAYEIEATANEREMVPTVATAYVQSDLADDSGVASCSKNVCNETDRRFIRITPLRVFAVPRI
jgi:hypothetical protein